MKEKIKGLDGLRGIAVLMVLVAHWIPQNGFFEFFVFGAMGVGLFYVISGYLITKILLENKKQIGEMRLSVGKSLKMFYLKRCLRIFPIYYIVLGILFLLNFDTIHQKILWFLFYGQNFHIFNYHTITDYLGHFWSLAVEEQFYLIWPFLILFVNKKYLYPVFFILLLSPFLSDTLILCYYGYNNYLFISFLTSHCIPALAIGGLLAFDEFNSYEKRMNWLFSDKVMFYSVFLFLLFSSLKVNYIVMTLRDMSWWLFSAIIVNRVVLKKYLFLDYILSFKVVSFIGIISYGIYVYHPFSYLLNHYMHILCLKHNWRIPIIGVIPFPEFEQPFFRFLWRFFITLILALTSWFIIEKPLLRLKKRII